MPTAARNSARAAFALAALAVSSNLRADEATFTESRAWVLTDQRLVELDLESGSTLRFLPLGGGERLLSGEPSSPPLVRRVDGSLLWVGDADGAGLTPHDLADSVPDARFVVAAPGGRWLTISDQALAFAGGSGDRSAVQLLPRRAAVLASDGSRVWGLGSEGAFRLGRRLGVGSAEVEAPFDRSAMSTLTEPRAACYDPGDDVVLVADAQGLRIFTAAGDPVGSVLLEGITRLVCGAFGRVWGATDHELRLYRVLGGELELERRVVLGETSTVGALRVDPRDFSPIVGDGEGVASLDETGRTRWQWRPDRGERVVDVEVSCCGPVGSSIAKRRPFVAGEAAVESSPSESTTLVDDVLLTGTVVAAETATDTPSYAGDPIAGAEVSVFGDGIDRSTSDVDGSFSVLATPRSTSPMLNVVTRKDQGAFELQTFVRTLNVSPGVTQQDLGTIGLTAPCGVGFRAGLFPSGALNGDVRAMTVFDDGTGPQLYVGGTFTTAGGVTVNRVARWNGSTWSALGSGLTDTSSPSVDALVVFDDGSGPRLYAGGKFTKTGSTTVKYVAQWTGSTWAQVGLGLASQVLALAVHDDGTGSKLFAGGSFTTANSVTYNRLAKWTGSSWVAVNGGANNTVRALASFDDGTGPALHVGGSFTQVGGSVSASRIARWNGSGWSALGTGVSGGTTLQVNALLPGERFGVPALVVGGRFTSAGGNAANHVASWDGVAWSSFDTGLGVQVNALGWFDDGLGPRLYAAGSFTTVSGEAYNRIARWSGAYWAPLGSGLNGNALSLAAGPVAGESAFFVGGSFGTADGAASTRLARVERRTNCTDLDRPSLYWSGPIAGAVVSTTTPLLTLGLHERGSAGLNPATFEIRQGGVLVPVDCDFLSDAVECVPLQPFVAGSVTLEATIQDHAGNAPFSPASVTFSIAESTPPSLAFVEPTPGAVLPMARPVLRFAYSDDGAGVDLDSLAVSFAGSPLSLECDLGPATGVCVPVADLASGPGQLSATIRDLQGNESAPATVAVEIQAQGLPVTTIVGSTVFEDGSPASGARVWLTDEAGIWIDSAGDGSFALPATEVEPGQTLALSARWTTTGATYLGFLERVPVVAGGTTDAGDLVLRLRCDGYFTPLPFSAPDSTLVGDILDVAVWDPGDGARLVVGGDFNYGGNGTLGRVAEWSAQGWRDLQGGVRHDTQPSVRALAVFDDGTGPALYAGGTFTTAGGAPASYLAQWDGEQWREVGRGLNGSVTALAVFDDGAGPALYVAGNFTRVQTRLDWAGVDRSIAAARAVKWDGTSWSEVGGGLVYSGSGMSFQLGVLEDASGMHLYAWEDDGYQIWKLTGGSWVEFGPWGNDVHSMASADLGSGPEVYAAISEFGIVRWTGSSWETVLSESWTDHRLAGFTDASGSYLYASGPFDTLGGELLVPELRRWNGSSWSAPLGDAGEIEVVGGLESQPLLVRSSPLAKWTGSTWEAFPIEPGDTEGAVTTVALLGEETPPSVLFTGLVRAGGIQLDGGIGRWDGNQVTPAMTGLPGGNRVVQSFDGQRIRTYGIAEATGQVAEWNGAGWTALGDAIGVAIRDVDWIDAGDGLRLYAAGTGVFRWNGAFWYALGGPSGLETIEGFLGQTYVGGTGGLRVWNGSSWVTVGPTGETGPDGPVRALEAFGSVLQIGGDFYDVGGAAEHYGFVGWNGTTWVAGQGPVCGYLKNRFLSGSVAQSPQPASIRALASFDDGQTVKLVTGGDYAAQFTSCSSTNYGSVLSYVNVGLGNGADGPPVQALAVGRWQGAPAVAVGGAFAQADGKPAARLAIWHTSPSAASCSPAGAPPRITIVAPATPFVTASTVTLAGAIDEPATLKIGGVEVAVTSDRTFSTQVALEEGNNSFFLEATDRDGVVGTLVHTLVRDTAPPAITIDQPANGARLFTTELQIDLRFEDATSGVDPETLELQVAGVPVPLSACELRSDRARCVAAASAGAIAITATVRDRAGNLSVPTTVSVTVDPAAGNSTQLAGRVEYSDGSPALGARVRILGRPGFETLSVADGSFDATVAPLGSDRSWTVVAEIAQGTTVLVGVATGLSPVPGGTTWTGTLRLHAGCDLEAGIGLFGEVGVAGRVRAFALFDDGSGPALYVGGSSLRTDAAGTHHLLRWTGEQLETLPSGPSGPVYALAPYDDGSGAKLYAGGVFTQAGGVPVSSLARWDGSTWEDVDGGVRTSVTVPGSGCVVAPGTVEALRVFDDGSGPALYVAGDFVQVGAGVVADLVARWSGAGWTGYGPSSTCNSRKVYALEVYDDGSGSALYAGGSFATLGGQPVSRVARLESGTWVPLGWGLGGLTDQGSYYLAHVTSLAVFDSGDGPELVAAGLFNRAGDLTQSVASIARWNGVRWAPLGSGLEANYTSLSERSGVQALAVHDDGSGSALYATGSFTGSTRERYTSIARWNGATWTPVGGGIGAPSTGGMALLSAGGELFVGGGLPTAGGLGARGVARWTGQSWKPLGLGLDGAVRALTVFDDGTGTALYVGGDFISYGETRLDHVGRFDGERWSPLGSGTDGPVWALEVYDDGGGAELWAGGRFGVAGGTAAANIARWNGAIWSPLAGGITKGGSVVAATVYALEAHDDGSGPALYVGGDLDAADGVTRQGIARWHGGAWSSLGSGIVGTVRALSEATVAGASRLYVGGTFSSAGGVSASNVARWDGASFAALGSGLGGVVNALAPWGGDRLLAGGQFSGNLSVWNGSTWSSPAGGTPSGAVSALASWNDGLGTGLFVGGSFSSVGSATPRLARWSGSGWSGVGAGLADGAVLALAPHENESGSFLYAGGTFSRADGESSLYLSRWNRPLTCGDTTPPTIAITAPTAGYLTTASPTLEVAYGDAHSAVDTTTLQWFRNGQPVETICTVAADTAQCLLLVPLPEGSSELIASIEDLAGNVGSSVPLALQVDTVGPTVSITAPLEGEILVSSEPTLTGTFSDSGSGVDPTTFDLALSGPGGSMSCTADATGATCTAATPFADGAWSAVLSVQDYAGAAGTDSVQFVVDTLPPALDLVSPVAGGITNDPTPAIQFAYSDAGSGVLASSLVVALDGGAASVSCVHEEGAAVCTPTAALGEGTHTITASIEDRAARTATLGPVVFEVRLDYEAPQITVTTPAANGFTNLTEVVVAGTVSEAATVTVNGIEATVAGDLTFLSPPMPLSEGPNALIVVATDATGNSAQVVRNLTRDTVAPGLSFTSPQPGGILDLTSAPVTLAVVESGSGLAPATTAFTANGVSVASSCSASPTTLTCDLIGVPGGLVTLVGIAADQAGNVSSPASVEFQSAAGVDLLPPVLIVQSPVPGSTVAVAEQTVRGSVSEPATITLNGAPVELYETLQFASQPLVLTEGANSFLLAAVDAAGNPASLSFTLTLDSMAPDPLVDALVSVSEIAAGTHEVSGVAGSVPSPPGARVVARMPLTGESWTFTPAADGSFSGAIQGFPEDQVRLVVVDDAGNESAAIVRVLSGTVPPIPDPATVAPRTDPALPTPFCAASSFLWSGPNRLQYGTAAGAIDCERLVVVRGRVVDAAGAPIEGVVVSVSGQPDVGRTLTRADGVFDLAANGGGNVDLRYAKAGYLGVGRMLPAGWGAWVNAPEVVLTPVAPLATSVDFASSEPYQAIRGALVGDTAGSRQATLFVLQGTTAQLRLPGGGAQPLSTANVRATEYTVGARFLEALPAPAPSGVSVAYAAELSLDEAEAIGAESVEFSQDLPFYLENFIGLPVGLTVPAAYLDPTGGGWVPSENGLVLEILAELAGVAEVDVTGTGIAATPLELAELGITNEELTGLAATYEPGQELWRVPVRHFTPWLLGWPYRALSGARLPPFKIPTIGSQDDLDKPTVSRFAGTIEVDNQILGQTLDLVGTSQALHYRSDRVPGRKAPYLLTIPLSEEVLPPNLLRIDIEVNIAGQSILQSFAPQASQVHQVQWDGLDRFGRPVQGKELWTVAVSYVYPTDYVVPDSGNPAFGFVGGVRVSGVPARHEALYSRTSEGSMGALQAAAAFGLGGWSLTSHHSLDLEAGVLHYGDGRRRQLKNGRQEPAVAKRIAGTGQLGSSGDGGPAEAAQLWGPRGLSALRDGSLLIADHGNCRVRKIGTDGIITTIAGTTCGTGSEDVGDGLPATFARLYSPEKAIEGPDGRVYIVDRGHHRVRRIELDGTIRTVVGNGGLGCPADRVPAAEAPLEYPTDVAFDRNGDLLVLSEDSGYGPYCRGLRRVDASGQIQTVAERGMETCEEGPCFYLPRHPEGLAVALDGAMLIADASSIERRPPEGKHPDNKLWVIAGWPFLYGPNDHIFFAGDGMEASSENTRFFGPTQVAVGSSGAIYVADRLNFRARVIGPDNVVSTVLGGGENVPGAGEIPASQVALGEVMGVAVSPDGQSLYVSDTLTSSVYRVGLPEILGDTEKYVPSEDGSALYVFDAEGRHLRTEDSVTRQALLTFRYTAYPVPGGDPPETKLLTEIEDSFGNITRIERSESGEPERIVGPFGATTELELHPTTGFLRYVRRHLEVGIEQVEITTSGEGLIEALEDPKSHTYTYQWDTEGRLHRVLDPESGEITLDFTKTLTGHRVTQTTAEGRVSSTEVEFLPMGEIRQTVTLPTGHKIEALRKRDGSLEWTYPDDTVAVSEAAPEPRLGPLVKLSKKSTVTTPEDGRVLERTFDRSVSGWVGDPLGLAQQTDTTTVNGRVSTREYSAFDRILRTTSPEGRTSEVEFDTFGRLAEARQPNTEAVRVSYDPKGRVETVAQGQGALERKVQYAYNIEGHLDSVTDPLGEVVTFEYDAVGRVTKTILPDQREIRYEYDLNGNLVSLRPPTRPDHAFDHNAVDQVAEYAPPDLDPGTPEIPATTYGYNDDHQLTTITRPDGLMVSLAYETSGRLDGLTAPHGTIDYAYDAESGKLATITAPDGPTVSYDYDGPWLQQVTVGGPFSASIQLEADRPFTGQPDTNFWLGKLRINDDPATEIEYEHDGDGLPTKIGDLEMYYENETSRLVGTELFQTGDRVTRNGFGEMERYEAGFQEVPGGGSPPLVGTKLLDITYQRDKLGRIERKVETSRATPASSPVTHVYEYEYDPERGWLEEVTLDGIPVETYAYDANGNRTSWSTTFGSGTATYDDQDRLLTYGPYTYTYTANGELLTKSNGSATTTYGYDVFGNLRTVTLPDGIAIEYLIDGRNRRIGKKVNGTLVQRFLYLGGLSPIAELDAAGNVTTQYLYGRGGNVPDGFVRDGVTYRILTDHLGSVRYVLDAQTGDVVQRLEYDAYGRVMLDTNPGFQPFGFAGGLYDYQTALVRFGARDYDPLAARWSTRDPALFGAGRTNYYSYCASDPLNRKDPQGLSDLFVVIEGEYAEIFGYDSSVGVVLDTDTPLESGLFYGVGPAIGASGGGGIGGGFMVRELEGSSLNLDGNFRAFSGAVSVDDVGINGATVTVGPGAGVVVSYTATESLTVQDVIDWTKEVGKKLKEGAEELAADVLAAISAVSGEVTPPISLTEPEPSVPPRD